jgi:hypothetical protein
MLGVGFNMTAGKGGLFKKLGGLFKGKQSAVTSAIGPLKKDGTPDMRFKDNKGLGGAGKGAAGTQAMGQSAGGQSANFLKGAVGLLAIV